MVAARHLWHYGYKPTIYYPKQSKNDLYQASLYDSLRYFTSMAKDQLTSSQRLSTQLKNLNIPFTDDFPAALKDSDHVVDAIFGSHLPIPSVAELFP